MPNHDRSGPARDGDDPVPRILAHMSLRPSSFDASARAADVESPAVPNLPQRRRIRSDDLFSGEREVMIEHAGELYSLRQTSKGKLILTK